MFCNPVQLVIRQGLAVVFEPDMPPGHVAMLVVSAPT
jgi:hypothetical protein